jgi:hypothetical protein
MTRTNEYQQPIGEAVIDWTPRERPARIAIEGKHCRIEPLDADRHAADPPIRFTTPSSIPRAARRSAHSR